MDQAKKLVEEKRLPEDFLSTADDLDNIAQKYKDEIRNQTVRQILYSIYFFSLYSIDWFLIIKNLTRLTVSRWRRWLRSQRNLEKIF